VLEPANMAAEGADGASSTLSGFGYRQELDRSLSLLSTFGLAFSYISPVVGVYTMFGLGICSGGAQFVLFMPVVVVGQLLVALVFADLSVRYPIAGGLYQWAAR
jgi:amino acid transporter